MVNLLTDFCSVHVDSLDSRHYGMSLPPSDSMLLVGHTILSVPFEHVEVVPKLI